MIIDKNNALKISSITTINALDISTILDTYSIKNIIWRFFI